MNARVFNDDVRQQIFPYYRYTRNGPTGQDMLGDYILAIMPVGFSFVYRSTAPFIDPEVLSKMLPYVLYVVTLIGLAMTSLRAGGPFLMLAVLALFLQTPTFLDRMTGGLSRAFAFPLLSLALWALLVGRIRMLAVLVAVGAAFYPAAGALLGLVLATVLIVIPSTDRGEAATWPWTRRFLVLAISAGTSFTLLLPTLFAVSPWGRPLGPDDQVLFPESGSSGRYGTTGWPVTQFSLHRLLADLAAEIQAALRSQDLPITQEIHRLISEFEPLLIQILLAYLLICILAIAAEKESARRLLALPAAGVLGYLIADTFAPHLYLPQRYLTFTVPLTLVFFLPLGTAALARLLVPVKWSVSAKRCGALLASATVIVFLGNRGNPMTGYTVTLESHAGIYEFIRDLPEDSLIAGWPLGVLDNVPYYCRRRAFLTYENHQALHERYVLEMRRRMRALLGALFGEDPTSLAKLRYDFGVTHLIVDSDKYIKAPTYFAPFDAEIEAVWRRGAVAGFAINRVMNRDIVVYRERNLAVIDLSLLKGELDR